VLVHFQKYVGIISDPWHGFKHAILFIVSFFNIPLVIIP